MTTLPLTAIERSRMIDSHRTTYPAILLSHPHQLRSRPSHSRYSSTQFIMTLTSPLTPTFSTLFSNRSYAAMPQKSLYSAPTHHQSLATFLSSEPSLLDTRDIAGSLEEYVYRSMVSGVRVREWCHDVNAVIDGVSCLRMCLQSARTVSS